MLFNSLEFLIFFPIVVGLYFATPYRYRWLFLLSSSLVFYAFWSPKYLIFLGISTIIDYIGSNMMQRDPARKKLYLLASLASNLGMLSTFKYLGFVDDNIRLLFEQVLHLPYRETPAWIENMILPVGISFYTFQSIGYTIDVFKGVTKPERHLGVFALFVAYWPQLVAGPIQRSNHLLPQLKLNHDFDYERVRSGLFRMLIGFFKKVVIADRLAAYVDHIYLNYDQATGATVWLGASLFYFQVYCDFAGYSDIAIGASRVLGIRLMENFKRPFFSKNLADFWTRWHISLSTWLTDYVFFYLGAYKSTGAKVVFNVIFVLSICGLWHGANWPMVLSFSLIGVFMAIRYLWQYNVVRHIRQSNLWKRWERLPGWVDILLTFHILIFAFLLFRVDSAVNMMKREAIAASGIPKTELTSQVKQEIFEQVPAWSHVAKTMYSNLFKFGEAGFLPDVMAHKGEANFFLGIFFLLLLLWAEWKVGDRLMEEVVLARGKWFRWGAYAFLLTCILWFGVFNESEFVYFQY